jgi:hypothetical protein
VHHLVHIAVLHTFFPVVDEAVVFKILFLFILISLASGPRLLVALLRALKVGFWLNFLPFLEVFEHLMEFAEHLNDQLHEPVPDVSVESLQEELIVVQEELHAIAAEFLNEFLLDTGQLLHEMDQQQAEVLCDGRAHEFLHVKSVVERSVLEHAREVELITDY